MTITIHLTEGAIRALIFIAGIFVGGILARLSRHILGSE